MNNKEISELVNRYGIKLMRDGRVYVADADRVAKDGKLAYLKEHKDEIAAYLDPQRPQRVADSIPGLREIQLAMKAEVEWRAAFDRAMDTDGDLADLPERPDPGLVERLRFEHPMAAAYLEASAMTAKDNLELSAIGSEALARIVDDPEDYAAIIEDMHREEKAFVERHIWD